MRRAIALALLTGAALIAPAQITGAETAGAARPTAQSGALRGIHKIRHVVIIMQENRSFDSYFGTYPGADGISHETAGRRPA